MQPAYIWVGVSFLLLSIQRPTEVASLIAVGSNCCRSISLLYECVAASSAVFGCGHVLHKQGFLASGFALGGRNDDLCPCGAQIFDCQGSCSDRASKVSRKTMTSSRALLTPWPMSGGKQWRASPMTTFVLTDPSDIRCSTPENKCSTS